MVDRITAEKRSWNMGRIRGKDTAPELRVRSELHRMGYRFRLHQKDLPGSPDIVLPKFRTVIFVHGCFWHRHAGCRLNYSPKTRVKFWESKFEKNVSRDRQNAAALKDAGWNVAIIWECSTRDQKDLIKRIQKIFIDYKSAEV